MHLKKTNKIIKGIVSPLLLTLGMFNMSNVYAMDQCNTTQQCRTTFGNRATDCLNSQSNNSVCMCGSERCDAGSNPAPTPSPGGSNMLGQVDKSKDAVFFFFDNKPDADDIQSQAGVGTMLRDPRFRGLNYWGVLGTTGQQRSAFLNSNTVMDLCLGAGNWVLSHPITSGPTGSPRGTSQWNNALNQTQSRALSVLNGGGDIFIVEAGQSDFSADLVRRIKQRNGSINTKQRVHIYQHSTLPAFNERQTREADLNYVMNNTDYTRVPNGNSGGNGSPQLTSRSGAQFNKAISLGAGAGACWREARRVANANNFGGNGHYENPSIEAGGFDFSDVVEFTYFTGFNSLRNVNDFFNEFDNPVALNTANPTPAPTAPPAPTPTPAPFPAEPVDQCDLTQQCKNIFGNRATDCANSRSDMSICMCGSEPCGDLPGTSPTPTPAPRNLLSNSGFESGNLNGWGGYGTRVISNDAASGSNAGRVTGVGAFSQVLSGLRANTTYVYSAQVKVNAGDRAFFGVKEHGRAEQANTITNTSYQGTTLRFTTGANSTSAQVYFFLAGAGDVAFIDQASLVADSGGAPAPTPTPAPTPNPSPSGAFQEQNGLVVVDLESVNAPGGWASQSGSGSIGGFLNWQGNDSFGNPGNGTLTVKVNITSPGTYRFLWRNSIRKANVANTDHNDSWLRIVANNFYGKKGSSTVCPVGKLSGNACSGSRPKGSSANGWFKVYRSGGSPLDWNWVTSTSDNDAHSIFAQFNRAGVYDVQISGRSKDHGIDRFVMFREGNASNNVSQAFATNSNRPQSPRN